MGHRTCNCKTEMSCQLCDRQSELGTRSREKSAVSREERELTWQPEEEKGRRPADVASCGEENCPAACQIALQRETTPGDLSVRVSEIICIFIHSRGWNVWSSYGEDNYHDSSLQDAS